MPKLKKDLPKFGFSALGKHPAFPMSKKNDVGSALGRIRKIKR